MRVAIYTRVSTKDQSPNIQIDELRRYADRRNFSIHDVYVDTVTGAVGKRTKRTRYDDLMEDAQKNLFDCVLVWKYDRFARSVIHLASALETFAKLNINFISFNENIDTTSPMGKLFFHIMASIAEFERELIAERTRIGLQLVKDTGRNAKGQLVTLGRPELVSDDKKQNILRRYEAWEKLAIIATSENMPLPTIYSIIKRSMVRCSHGKYRCKSCRKSRRISLRIDSRGTSETSRHDASSLLGVDRASASYRGTKAMRSDGERFFPTCQNPA